MLNGRIIVETRDVRMDTTNSIIDNLKRMLLLTIQYSLQISVLKGTYTWYFPAMSNVAVSRDILEG